MTDGTIDRERLTLLQRARIWSPLHEVVEAVSVASGEIRLVYVERRDDLYRWSPAGTGGGYPILRIVARFLRLSHHDVLVGFRTLPDGTAIHASEPEDFDVPDVWSLIDTDAPLDQAAAERAIVAALASGQGGTS